MKKLMVLSLVLAVSVVSSAALELSELEGLSYIVDQEAKSVSVYSSFGVSGFSFNLMPGITGVVVSSAFQTANEPGSLAIDEGFEPEDYPVGTWLLAGGANSSLVTGLLATISYADGVESIMFFNEDLWGYGASWVNDGSKEIALDGYSMVIPEPMTMGLLGLGALFLRRRK